MEGGEKERTDKLGWVGPEQLVVLRLVGDEDKISIRGKRNQARIRRLHVGGPDERDLGSPYYSTRESMNSERKASNQIRNLERGRGVVDKKSDYEGRMTPGSKAEAKDHMAY